MSDGMMGQGLRVLVLLTTNEPVAQFHRAVVRPGRCLSLTEFGPLPGEQVDRWLRSRGLDPMGRSACLSELHAIARGETDWEGQSDHPQVGFVP